MQWPIQDNIILMYVRVKVCDEIGIKEMFSKTTNSIVIFL